MTDNDVIKALETCVKEGTCAECPCYAGSASCLLNLTTNTLDLIKRQKEELERLKAEIKNTDNILNSLDRPLVEVEYKAIKDFAERLKEKALTKYDWNDCVDVEEIDILVKEMTEGVKIND